MTRTFVRSSAVALAAAISLVSSSLAYADDGAPVSVVVSFGAGINTAQPGNAANHHVLPRTIHVKVGGVVNFAVSGFHQIYVYNPGKRPDDVVPNVNPASLFINDETDLYYKGIVPAGGPPPGNPGTTNPSNASNRMEGVSFSKPGTYLVICNVAPHFADGMWAWIRVTKGGGGHDHDD
jgi:plastocyanin